MVVVVQCVVVDAALALAPAGMAPLGCSSLLAPEVVSGSPLTNPAGTATNLHRACRPGAGGSSGASQS